MIAGATGRMRGGDPTVASAIVAATVGMLIRAIHERLGFVGTLIASLRPLVIRSRGR